MDVSLTNLLDMLAKHGPGFLVGAIFVALYLYERRTHTKFTEDREANYAKQTSDREATFQKDTAAKDAAFAKEIAEERARNDKLSDRVMTLSEESIRADINHAKAIEMLERTIDRRQP